MVKRDIKKVFFILLIVINIGLVSASYKLVCPGEGQVLRFSECNPSMDDFLCEHTKCQVCVNEISSGVYCPASINRCDDICTEIEEPEEPPVIILVEPGDGYQQNDSDEVRFEYDVERAYLVRSCSLFIDGEEVDSSTRLRNTGNRFEYEVPEGIYHWFIECYPREGFEIYYSEEREMIIGNYTPEPTTINLKNPGNGKTYTGDSVSVNFQYDISNPEGLEQCNLILYNKNSNQETVYGNSSVIRTTNSIKKTLNSASYKWRVECLVGSETISSSELSFAVKESSGGGGGGSSGGSGGSGGGSSGGGSGGSSSSTNSTNSTEVIELTPKEKNEKTESSDGNKEDDKIQEQNTEEIVESSFDITGAAVWSNIKENRALSVFIVGLIVIVGIFGYLGYRKK
ncbi:hypothetical protein GF386_05250 [Candidatus Pacearchaeota archaeon]|nr:hypothetical protein [Candidatus Pacearchaeota archaeon]